jgi:hypothetical protein
LRAGTHGYGKRNPATDIRPRDILKASLKSNYARIDTKVLPNLLNYGLRSAEIPRLIEIYNGIRQIPSKESFAPLRFAIRRFNSSYGKLRHEDRLLDCTIALESLLVSDERDLSLQFRLYGALLLEPNRQRAKTYDFLKKLYGYRSKIVHKGGDIPDLLKASADSGVSFLEETFQITREVIVAFLECSGNGEPPAKVRQRIEGRLLSS